MAIEVTPIAGSNGIGCEVHGLTYDALSDTKVREQLVKNWVDHGLIVFRKVQGADFQIKLTGVFGNSEAHPHASANVAGPPSELVQIAYDPENADIYEIDGKRLGGWLPWHQDLVYLDEVSRGSILRPVLLPYEGGKTGYIDSIKLYQKLSPEMQKRIEGLSVVYHFDMDVENLKYARPQSIKVIRLSNLYSKLVGQKDQFPRVRHPLVYRQTETNRPVLNFSPYFAQEIAGIPASESEEILTTIGNLCLDPANHYFHEWRLDDMVLWDNWRMLHAAGGVPIDAKRIMERSHIMGGYRMGELDSDGKTITHEMRVTV